MSAYKKNKLPPPSAIETAQQDYDAAKRSEAEAGEWLRQATVKWIAANNGIGPAADAAKDRAMVEKAAASVAIARAKVAVHKAGAELAALRTKEAIESGDADAIACDFRIVAADVRRIFEEGTRAEQELQRIQTEIWDQTVDVRETLSKLATLRALSVEAGTLAEARMHHAKEANMRLRTRFGQEGKPLPPKFPAKPGFTVGAGEWYAEVVSLVVEGEDNTLENLENNVLRLESEETDMRARMQRAVEERHRAEVAWAEERANRRRIEAQEADKLRAEQAQMRAQVQKNEAEQRRLAEAHRKRMGG